jgi:YggT family protein
VVLIRLLIDVYSLFVLGAVILSWVPAARSHPVARLVESATEPVLARIRAVVPPVGGFDWSAMLLLVALGLLKRLVF